MGDRWVCLLGGGTVEELALKPQYGGTLLKEIFPYIVAESDYAGQLKGFSTPNDFIYFLVDIGPYVLSLPGLIIMEWSRRKGFAPIFGLAIILTFIPFMSIPGDYYEAPSLMTTRLGPAIDSSLGPRDLISDDVFRSIASLSESGQLHFGTILLILAGLIASIYGTLLTLAFQVILARKVWGTDFMSPGGES